MEFAKCICHLLRRNNIDDLNKISTEQIREYILTLKKILNLLENGALAKAAPDADLRCISNYIRIIL